MKKVLCLLFISFGLFSTTMKNESFSQDNVQSQATQNEVKQKKEKKINPKKVVQSTQGVDIDQNITKTLKRSKEQNKEIKTKQKKSNDYIRHKNKQKKLYRKLKYKERELEFINHRLELHQQKFDEYTNTETEKGEKE